MRLAIPATSPELDAAAESRFGRCACFLIVDADTLDHEVVENTAAGEPSGAGIAAALLVADAGAQAAIVRNLGPKAMDTLIARGVTPYQGIVGSVREQVQAYLGGQLQPLSAPSVGDKYGVGGRGRGMGGGGGRGMGGGGRGMGGGGRGMGGGGRGTGGGGRGMGGGGRGKRSGRRFSHHADAHCGRSAETSRRAAPWSGF